MSRRRIYVPRDSIRDGVAFLRRDQVHYLRDVLRLKAGDPAEVFDGEGENFVGFVQIHGAETRIGELVPASCNAEPDWPLLLAIALIKTDKLELVLQKATELGVTEIQPLETRYSEVRIPEGKIASRLERWAKIVQEAARQCGRARVPKVKTPSPFLEFIRSSGPIGAARIFFHEQAARPWTPALVPAGSALVAVGPEGGWHEEELQAAGDSGFIAFNLGPRILRAETAAIAALTLVQFRVAKSGLEIENETG
jgi:16S rRNA (uracil1498-N3)-methyltransferase